MTHGLETHEDALRALAGSRGVQFGLPSLDAAIRGCRYGDLSLVAGPPHGGKTQTVMHLVLNNPDRRVIWFAPDESHSFLIQKLAAIHYGLDQETVEKMALDKKGRRALQKFVDGLENLKVSERQSAEEVIEDIKQASKDWGAKPDVCVFDYADLLEGSGNGYQETTLKQKMVWFKSTAKTVQCAMVVVHQALKAAIRATPYTDPSLADIDTAGHKEATLVLWCRRPPASTSSEKLRQQANPSIEAWVLKNKWQPNRPDAAIPLYIGPGGRLRSA